MGVTLDHDAVFELLGAWAVDACDDDEARAVEAHIAACAECAREAAKLREAAGWLGSLETAAPPPGLELSVMAAARARRGGAIVVPSRPAELVAHQADALDTLLGSLRPGEWHTVTAAGWTVHELVGHLLAAASYLTWQLGLLPEDPAHGETQWVPRSEAVIDGERHRTPAETVAAWRRQADLLRAHVATAGEDEMDRAIPWFDGAAPLVVLAVVHGFETWVHAEDIRRATGRPPLPPSASDLACMSDLAVDLVGEAMRSAEVGRARGSGSVRVVLTGAGGTDRTVELGDVAPAPGEPDTTFVADVVAFCTLVGGRMRPDELTCTVDGDPALARELLAAAASLAFP